ncbi:MAG: N-acetylmannosamine-6-phosphate 2-epimerase [Caldilineaceae bacterium]|nr:N-acetylmannosamine-6-phosphate 2-epimerase [Caldilineaceae bacterium]
MGIPTASDRKQQVADFVERVRGRLIVSCQALPHEPLHGAWIMARMAVAAKEGGGVAIRANGPEDIRAIRAAVDLPIVGLFKDNIPGYDVYITPSMEHVRAVVAAGTDIVAIDATARSRPQPGTLADYIAAIHEETGRPVLADISTLEEGIAAEAAGADFISTTMSGYTPYSPQQADPDLDLVRQLAARLRVPLLAEGRYRTPEQVRAALDAGALAAIVGGAITRPQEITRWFVEGIRNA